MMLASLKLHSAWAGALLVLTPVQGLSGTVAEAGDFAGYAVVSDEELAALRGGFEVYIGGQLLSLAFSLERVSYLNGELLTRTRIEIPDIAVAIHSPETVSVSTHVAQPASAAGAAVPSSPSPPVVADSAGVASPAAVETADIPASPAPRNAGVSVAGPQGGNYVTLIQNGAGNSVALPTHADVQVNQALQAAEAQILQAHNQVLVIQNSLDDQMIQNMTTLNVTLTNEALSRAAEMNAALSQLLSAPLVIRP